MSWYTVLRLAATAAIGGLIAAEQYYHYPWIAIAAATLAGLGIHVIPSATQNGGKP